MLRLETRSPVSGSNGRQDATCAPGGIMKGMRPTIAGIGISHPGFFMKALGAAIAAARAHLDTFVKTTGGRGLHVVVPLVPKADWSECLAFARAFAASVVRLSPALFTDQFAKIGRERKILVDYLRNNRTNTSIAAYSTRARPDAQVSVPLAWTELSPAKPPDRFTAVTVPQRLARLRNDPWKKYWTTRQQIPRGAVGALETL